MALIAEIESIENVNGKTSGEETLGTLDARICI
jgi:hypothetical protein